MTTHVSSKGYLTSIRGGTRASFREVNGNEDGEKRLGFGYQEALRMPGRSPSDAISRKVMRERPNLRM
jgi:hypothetical protein